MGVFDLCFRGDQGCGSYQGKGSSPLLSDGDGGLGLGQEGGRWTSSSNEGDAVLYCISESPCTKDPRIGSQGNEALLCHKTRLMFHLQDDILEAGHNSLEYTISRNKIDFNVILEMLRVWRRKIGGCHTIITECLDTNKSGFPNSPVRITKSFD